MASTTEELSIAQLRLQAIAKEQTVELLTNRIEFLKIEITAIYEKIKQLEE
jgi:hypothetical protein